MVYRLVCMLVFLSQLYRVWRILFSSFCIAVRLSELCHLHFETGSCKRKNARVSMIRECRVQHRPGAVWGTRSCLSGSGPPIAPPAPHIPTSSFNPLESTVTPHPSPRRASRNPKDKIKPTKCPPASPPNPTSPLSLPTTPPPNPQTQPQQSPSPSLTPRNPPPPSSSSSVRIP